MGNDDRTINFLPNSRKNDDTDPKYAHGVEVQEISKKKSDQIQGSLSKNIFRTRQDLDVKFAKENLFLTSSKQ